jgi:hypothetical protein
MRRPLEVLGFLMAALALTAWAAQAASAASEFQAAEFPARLSGEQSGEKGHVFTVEEKNSLTCTKMTATGELFEPSEAQEVSPTYSSCTAFGFSATVTMHGCVYRLHAGEETSANHFSGTIDIVCPPGEKIAMAAGTCEVQVGSQEGLSGVEYVDNTGHSPVDVTVNLSVTGIKYNKVKDGIGCPLNGTGEKSDGTYSGATLVKGFKKNEEKEEATAVAVQKKVNTKLCQEDPKGKPCTNAYGIKPIKSALKAGAAAYLNIEGIGAIECTSSEMNGEMEAAEGAPLPIKDFLVTFKAGTCQTTPAKTACGKVEMEGGKVKGKIWAFTVASGRGNLFAPMTLYAECGKEVVCKYSSQKHFSVAMTPGATGVTTLQVVNQTLERQKGIPNEAGCSDEAVWFGVWFLSEPQPLWVSN